ncbi:biotin--[acetyl-CoA-carboxylase] ligase [Winogradskyella poriferorum]|uniref:biotin--[acetyl-CoA-carboxylase] ligase n=1 Tax=Winogradskyella poriferorum TaxID=307627 RepID=UPI003D64BE53
MYVIKLDAIDSTNAYLKGLTLKSMPSDYTVVVAEKQTQGRGQRGTKWQSEVGKNLTISVFKKIEGLRVEQQFYISICVSLAIMDCLKKFQIPQLRIKWPNDILSANKKICGILIENIIKNNKLVGCIVGIGLNVNQRNFQQLPQASSLGSITGIVYDKEEILSEVLNQLEKYFKSIESFNLVALKANYESQLFRLSKPCTFKLSDDSLLSGIIKGIDETGQLRVWTEDDVIKTFDLKELTLLY